MRPGCTRQQHRALQDALNELAQARADRRDLLEAVSAAQQARLDLSNMASQIAGRKADATERNRSMDLAVWLYDKGILSSCAAELFGIPETVLMYRMGYLGEGPTFDLPPDEWTHDVVTTLRLAINDISNTVINRDPEIMSGTPVFIGTRVTVSTLIDHMLDGYTLDYFLDHFPSVSREQAEQFLELVRETLTAEED